MGTLALGVLFSALLYARVRWKTRLNAMSPLERAAELTFFARLLLSHVPIVAGTAIALSLGDFGSFSTMLVVMLAFIVFASGNILILIRSHRDLVRAALRAG